MSTTRPASLDGSLLARKGDASPAIANDSPLLEELGEPRPAQRGDRSSAENPDTRSTGAVVGLPGRGLAWLTAHPIFGVLGLAIGIAILFAVTIAALTPSSESVSPPVLPETSDSATSSEKIILPTDSKSMTEPADIAMEAVPRPAESAMVPPEPPATIAPPDTPATLTSPEPPAMAAPSAPPKKAAARPVAAPATAKPSGRSGQYLLQLSAVGTARAARQELKRLEKRLGRVLGKRKIIVVKAVPPGKPPVYRLRASAYESRAAARAACKRIRSRKMACIVVRR